MFSIFHEVGHYCIQIQIVIFHLLTIHGLYHLIFYLKIQLHIQGYHLKSMIVQHLYEVEVQSYLQNLNERMLQTKKVERILLNML